MEKQKNKYLDELNIPIEKYGTNFTDEADSRIRIWEKQKNEYGFDERETWNMDIIFIEWLYGHCMMYKEASCVDLTYHKIEYNDKEYTQLEAIDYIINATKNFLQEKQNVNKGIENKNTFKNVEIALHLWAEVFSFMWW